MATIIAQQKELSPALPVVVGNKDFKIYQSILNRIDEILVDSEIEKRVMQIFLDREEEVNKKLSDKRKSKIQDKARLALRCSILRSLFQESFRRLSSRIAESPVLQKFCQIDRIDKIKVPSKSTLERFEKELKEEEIYELIISVIQTASGPQNKLDLEKKIDLSEVYIDLTCVKANVHYPVDWVLIKDAIKTLTQKVILIRKNGLKNRMKNPEKFITEINKLSMEMTHVKYKTDAKAQKKRILRLMKKLAKKVSQHAQKHRDLLAERWQETDLSKKEAKNIENGINAILNIFPLVIKQAHERIIGERQVKDKDKILSLYEPDIHVIVRGKAGARVEFGNTLVLCEQADGLIIDWKLYKEKAPADCKTIIPCVKRIDDNFNQPLKGVTGDRGCWDKKTADYLEEKNIKNCICPRSVAQMQIEMKDEIFRVNQKRRAQTEGRIGIFKNCFIGNPITSKGIQNKKKNVAIAVLTHNLWILARMPKKEEDDILKAA